MEQARCTHGREVGEAVDAFDALDLPELVGQPLDGAQGAVVEHPLFGVAKNDQRDAVAAELVDHVVERLDGRRVFGEPNSIGRLEFELREPRSRSRDRERNGRKYDPLEPNGSLGVGGDSALPLTHCR